MDLLQALLMMSWFIFCEGKVMVQSSMENLSVWNPLTTRTTSQTDIWLQILIGSFRLAGEDLVKLLRIHPEG